MSKWDSRSRNSRALKRAAGTIVEQLEKRLMLSGSTDQTLTSGLVTSTGSSTDTGIVAPATQPTTRTGVRADSTSLQSASISSATQQILLQGLNELNTLGPSLVGGAAWSAILPLAGQSISSQVDVAGLVSTLLQPTINALSGTQTLTTDNLVSLLQQAAINAGTGTSSSVGTVTGGFDSTNNQLLFTAPVTATHTSTIRLDAGQVASAMGIVFGADATVTLTISLTLNLTFGASLDSAVPSNQQFFVRLNNLTGSATINASNLSSSINVGFLKASIVNGSASLNGQIQVSLNGADSSGDVTYAQLVGTAPAQLFAVQTQGSASANLPVAASLPGLSVSGTPTLTLQSSDPFSGRSLAVSTNADFAALNPFENASPASIFSMLQTLVSDLNQIGKGADQGSASSLLSTKIPFSGGKTIRDLLTLGQAFQDKIIAPLSTATNTPNFTDAQSLLTALTQALGSGTSATYDPTAHRLTFQVNVSDNFSSLTVPMSFDLSMGALGGISSSSTVKITPGASLNMSVAIDLTPSVDVLTASSDAPVNGQLPGDAHFTVDLGAATGLNGADVPIAVTVPADPTNQSIDDLVSDINTALVASGLGGLVIAGRNGNRITLGTTFSSVGASLALQVTAADPATTALGFVNGSKATSSEANNDRLSIQNATAKGTISLTTPSNINASAHYGFLGVAVNNGTASANAEADLSLTPGALSLTQIASALINPATLVSSLNVSGSASASLPITVTPSIANAAISGTPTLSVSLANITNPAGAIVTAPQLGNLSSLANMSFANAMSALNQLISYLQSLAPLPEFGGKLPLINKSVDDLLGYSQKLINVLTQIANSPDTTLQALSTDLNNRLQASGVHTAAVALSIDNDAIKAAIHYQPVDFSATEPFSLSLQDLANLLPSSSPAKAALNGLGDIAQVGATGSVSAKASADLELDLGIRLTTDPNDVTRGPFTPFIYDSSRVSLTAQLDATNLNASVNLGPVGLFIVNGSAHLTKETNPTLVEAPAEIGLTLPPITGHRYYFDQVVDVAQPVLQGQMSLDLPLSTPTVTNSIGDLTAFADLSNIAGTINVTAPDLADAMKNFDLLSNLGVIVDGLDSLLGVVSDGLNDLAFVKSLPLVGDHLQDAFTFINDLRTTLRTKLEPLVQNPGGDAITEARTLIAQALGSALSDTNNDGQHTYLDVPYTTTDTDGDGIVDKVEFELPIDEMVQTAVPFDLGLPALNLTASGSVLVTADFHLDLKFGVSAADGFFIDTNYPQGVHAVSANVSVSLPATLSGVLGFLHVNISDLGLADGNPSDSTNFSAGLALDLKTPPNLSGSDIPFTDLVGGVYDATDLASVTLSGSAAVNLRLAVDFGDEGTFPHIQADLHVNWGFDGDPESAANTPTVSFDNVRLELGTFVSKLLGPVMSKIQDVLNPIMPVLNFLNGRVPVVSDIAGKDITWAEVLIGDGSLLQDLTGGGNIDPNSVSDTGTSANFSFIKDLITVDQLANEVPTQGSGAYINLGSFSLAGDDLRDPGSDVSKLTSFAQTQIADVASQLAALGNDGNSDDSSDASFLSSVGNLDGTNTGFDFPLFDDPTQAFRLLLGQDISLVTFTPPQLNFNKNFHFDFSPFWPLTLTFGGDLAGTSNIEFGYDTHGLRQYLSGGDALDLLDGFYASSTGTENGTALPELSLHMDMYVSGGLDADVANLDAKGQLNVDVNANLNDPNHDGKVHADEIAYELKNQSDLRDKILSILDLTGSVGWSVDITASVGPLSKSFNVASGTILNFDTNQVLNGTTLPDRFEANDTQATAADLGVAPGIHVSGMSLHAAADKDFYKFTVVRPGAINITLNYQSSYVPGQIEYDVLDSKGNIVATGRGSGDNVVATLNEQPGTYYLKVFGAGQSVAGAYSLAFDPAPTSAQHVYYVNDGSTANSYYTYAIGNDSNSGTDPSAPKATIQAILSSYTLGPNDIIVVDSGTYSTVVSMAAAQAGVAIYGSPQNQTILQGTHITLAGGGTLLYGFAINNTSVTFTDAGGSTGAIVENDSFTGTSQLAVTGSADIESNTFNTSLAPAIDVDAGSNEIVKIIGNTISGASTGIIVDGTGGADISQNTINSASFYGIEVTTGIGALIDGNTISLSNGVAGIRASGDNTTIQNNTVTGGATYAIDIFVGDGDQVLNNILNGQATGIFSGSAGPITVNDNQISNTSTAGINLADTVSADVKSNTVNPSNGVAIEVGGGTAHTVSQNNIGGRGTTAIWLQGSGSGSVDYNVIASGYATDIEIDGSGSSDVSYNQFSSATAYGIYFTGAGGHSVSRNTGSTSNATAVVRADGGVNAIEDNTFTGNAQWGIDLDQTAYGQVDTNTFGTLSNTGIEVDGTGLVSITGNTFTGPSVYGIYVPNSTGATVQNNIFSTSSSTAQGIRLSADTSGLVSGNTLTGSSAIGIHLDGTSTSPVTGNSVSGATISIEQDGPSADIENNVLSGSSSYGIDVSAATSATILNNQITVNSGTGIEFDGNGSADIESNQLHNTRVAGINLKNATTVTLLSNQVTNSSQAGISATANGSMDVEGNTVSGSTTFGIVLNTSGAATLKTNQIQSMNGGQGIQVTAGSVTTLYQNSVSGGGADAIKVTASSVGPVTGNTVTAGNGQSFSRGIELATTTSGAITGNSTTGAILGIEFDGTGAIDAENNTISGANNYGLYAPSADGATVLNNTIHTNGNTGVWVGGAASSSSMDVESNTVSGSTTFGIVLDTTGAVTLKSNQLQSVNGGQGIQATAGSVTTLYQNTVSGGGSDAIKLTASSVGPVTGNTVTAGTQKTFARGTALVTTTAGAITGNNTTGAIIGIEFDGTGSIDAENNNLAGSSTYGLYAPSAVGATVLSNTINTNGGAGVWIGGAASNASMDVESNTVSGSTTFGIVLNTTDAVTLKSNQIQSMNGGQGIQVTAGSVTTLYQNSVSGGGNDAIEVTASSVGPVTGNTVAAGTFKSFSRGMALVTTTSGPITGNNVAGAGTSIEFDGTGSIDAENNTLAKSIIYGLYAPSAVGATVLNNTINTSNGSGVWIGGAGAADIENNPAITGTTVYGIYLPNVTGATIKNNGMQMSAGVGIQIQSGSSETIDSNTINGSGTYGIYLTAPASGAITHNTVGVSNSTNIRYDSPTVAANVANNTLSGSASYGIYLPSIGGAVLNNSIAAMQGIGIEADGTTPVDIEGNSGSGFNQYAIRVTHATLSTINNNGPMGLNGAQVGIEIDTGATTITGNTLTGSANYGIYTAPPTTGPIKSNVVNVAGANGIWFSNATVADIENNTVNGSSNEGIYVPSAVTSTLTSNTVSGTGSSTGIRVDVGTSAISDNTVAGTGAWGIYLPTATTASVIDNEISGQTTGLYSDRGNATVYGNKIHNNTTGAVSRGQIGGSDWSDPNLIYNNTTGVNLPVSTTLQFNRLYGNGVAIAAAPYANINHNIIYRNATAGILASGANNISVVNNTIYSPAGDSIRLVAGSTNASIENNILWSQAGYDLYVSTDSVAGLASDYNNLYTTGSGKVAFEVIDFTDILDWMLASGDDLHSIGTTRPNPTLDDPQFVNVAADDYHLTNVTSTSIDAGDPATPYALEPAPNGGRVNLGGYGNTPQAGASPASYLYLDSPRMYVDWVNSSFQYITWHSFNVSGNIDIEVDKEGVGKVADIAVVAVSQGQYLWSPQSSGLPADDSRYRIKITSVSNPAISTSSREAFAVPNQTHSYYVNDSSTTNDVYTTATGDNRNTGTSPADPKPSIAAVLRPYDLGAQDTIYVDTGHYIELQNLIISGISGIGDDEGVSITGPTDPTKQAILDRAYPYNGAYAMELDNADFTTVKNLTMTGGEIGLWIENGSTVFTGSNLTVTGNTHDGLRIESDCVNPVLDSITATNNGRYGIYSSTTMPSLEHSTIANNADTGLYLVNPGAIEVGGNAIYSNGTGINIFENDSVSLIIGDTNLSDSTALGNQIYDNAADGIDANGPVRIAGNSVYGQTGGGRWGISFSGGTVSNNDVDSNTNGIISYGGTVTANRVYANSGTGIYLYYGSNATLNDVYSNSVGIYVTSNSTVANNIVYSNSSFGIQLNNAGGTHLASNTVYQPAGDAVHVTSSSNVDVRNNILWAMAGADLYIASDSQVGFTSDYNDLVTSGSGVVGNWQGLAQATIAAWRNASFTDANSLSQDPLFISPKGADGQLGYVSAASDGRDDDFHLQSTDGAPTGSGFAPVIGSNGLPTLISPGSTTSGADSPAIDRGDPNSAFNLEPVPNGGYIDLGAYGDTAQASHSATTYVQVISPDGGEVWPQGQTFTIQWRTETTNPQTGGSSTDTYSIDLMKVGSSTPVLNIATGVSNSGQFNWTVPSTLSPESDYEIRVTRNGTQVGVSDQPFTIAAPIHLYYVNDSTVNAGDYTTVAGNDANDGLSPASPKASISAVLAAYHLTSNDVILVDAGTYALNNNIVVTSDDAGVTIRGYFSSANPSESTLIQRNNTASGSYGFELQGASGITLDHLDISGGQYGVYASSGSNSNNVTISNDTIHGNSSLNVYLPSSNNSPTLNNNNFSNAGLELDGSNAVFTNNTLHDSNNGAWIFSNGAVVTGNTAYNISSGSGALGVQSYTTADVENNVIYNSYVGIFTYQLTNQAVITVANNQLFNNNNGANLNGNTIATNNQVYGNTSVGINGGADVRGNFVYFNGTGIATSGLAEGNYVYDNGVGIASQYSGPVSGNHVYDNSTGITAGNGAITNNLIYNNGTAVYLVPGASGGTFDNNTVIQSSGLDAVVLASHPNFSARNNIFDIKTPGVHAYNISIDSENGFDSDYNDFDLASGAAIGIIGSTSYSSLASWNYQLNLDRHSSTADPQFVSNPAGTDGILGAVGGLNGAYYSSTDLSGTPVFTRVDSSLNFNNSNSPGGGISGNAWSARWMGDINIPTTGTFTFYAVADDGIQIFLDGSATPVISQWNYNGNQTDVASIALTAGLHSIEIDYHQLGGGAGLSLAWAGPGFVKTTLIGNFLSNEPGIAPGNYGLDDSFAVIPGSPTIDAGDPAFPYLSEPIPNGARINLGYTGNTSQATTSNAATVQVLMPNGLEKLTAYDAVNNPVTVPISIRSTGLTMQDSVIQLDAGSSTAVGSWLADAYHIGSTSTNTIGGGIDLSKITTALAPASVYTTFVGSYNNTLSYLLPVPYDTDNSYRLTLEFVEPYYNPGQRTFNIVINGQTVVPNYDIAAAAGGMNKAVEVTLPVSAVAGQGIRVDLVQTGNNNSPILSALALTHVNPNGLANPTVSLSYSIDGGSTYIPIASGIPLDSTGSAIYNWQVPATYTNDAIVKVSSDNAANVFDTSDQPFLITPATTTFYINDGSQTGDVYTTAPGNDANTGKSPDSPMASLSALLAAYGSTFKPGDIIEIDSGYYPLQSNIVLNAAEQGMTILGPSGAGAVFDRQSTSGGSEAFMLSNASGLTLENLSMTGGQNGIVVPNGSYSNNVSIIGCNVYNNSNTGIYFDTTNANITLTSNVVWNNPNGISLNNDRNLTLIGNTVYNTSNTAIFAEGQNITGTNNVAYNDGTGMWFYNINPVLPTDKLNVTGNVAYNDYYGLTVNGIGTASGNTVYDNTTGASVSGTLFTGNTVYRNSTGINNEGSTVTQNRVYLNSVGITTEFGGTITGNYIYDNTDGISSGGGITINNNIIYDNTRFGIWLQGNSGGAIENNTIVQPANDDIRLDNASGITIENNILENGAGFGIEFTDAAESGTHSDYNLFDPTGSGAMVNWGGAVFNNQQALTYATGQDRHSHVGDPGFVNPAGADGIRGYQAGGLNAAYYTSTDLSGTPAVTRIDSNFYNINYNNPPAPGISASTFSARWTGYIDVPVAGTYTFSERSDDGVRLYLNGSSTPVIDQWNYDYNNLHSGTIALAAGWQPIEIDYHNVGGGGGLSLMWSGPAFGTIPLYDSVLSPNPATSLGGDYGADDNFHLAPGSIAIDAGDPMLPYLNEPANNGVRADQGAYGNTSGAYVDPTRTLQVLSPGDWQKLQPGQTTNITWQMGGVGLQPVVRINSGGGAVGNYFPDTDLTVAYNSSGYSTPIDMSLVSGATPMSVYQDFDYAANGAGNEVAYQLPVPDGTYTIVLNFADDGSYGPNQRTFNILLNGQDVQPAFDIYAAAGGRDKAIDKTYTVTVTGGTGLHVELVNTGISNAIISGFELYRNTGVAVPAATQLDVSTDNGQTWHTITTTATTDANGHGSFAWDPTGYVTNGNTAIVRAISGGLTAYSDGTFLIAPAGTNYYVNDSLTGGDFYSTAPGNNANSGKTPGDPVASISVLLDNYTLTAGDTIYVDTGVYNLFRTIVIPASDSGARIVGPSGSTPTTNSYRDIVDAGQPVAYYRLGEAPGATTAVDLTGNNNATYSSGVTLGANGPLAGDSNTAASFDGVSGHVTLPSGFADFSQGLTFELWANPTLVNNNQLFVQLGDGSAGNLIVFGRSGITNNLMFQIYNGTSLVGSVIANNAIALNTWQQFVVTMTPTGNGSGNVVIYKNGVQIASGGVTMPAVVTRTTNYLGQSTGAGDRFYAGLLDEVAIYNKGISDIDVLAHYLAATRPIALIDRGSINYDTITVNGASNVDIENLDIAGGHIGIDVPSSVGSNGVAIRNNTIFGNHSDGVYVGSYDYQATVSGNEIFGIKADSNAVQYYGMEMYGYGPVITGNSFHDAGNYGLFMQAGGATVTNNKLWNNSTGGWVYFASTASGDPALVSGNTVFNNSTGMLVYYANLVTGNTAYSNSGVGLTIYNSTGIGNTAYGNGTGIYSGSSTISSNVTYSNSTGISADSSIVSSNRSYSNSVGIDLGTGSNQFVVDNLVYANTEEGIWIHGGGFDRVFNNTVYQAVGDALRLENVSSVTAYNNILVVQSGRDIYTASIGAGVDLDYNDLFISSDPNAAVGLYNGVTYTTLAAWRAASGRDNDSIFADPRFVDPDGADNILGVATNGSNYNGGADDNFSLAAGSPAIDSGDSWNAALTDATGAARQDDPGTANTGSPEYYLSDAGPSQFTTTGTAQGWHGSGGSNWALNLPFAFPFFGQTYTVAYVDANGFIQFGTNTGDTSTIPSHINLYPRIAALWDNLATYVGNDDIYVSSSGSQVTIRWAATHLPDNSPVNFSITLFPNGQIRFDYGSGNTSLNPVIGLFRGDSLTSRIATISGSTSLTNADSILYSLAPGVTDMGVFEFRGSSSDVTGPTILATTPSGVASGTFITTPITAFGLTFSEPINPVDALASANYDLRSPGPDGVYGTPDDDIIPLSISYDGAEQVTLTPLASMPVGTYRLTVHGSGGAAIHDLSGNSLDGDNNGLAGGDYVRTFLVRQPNTAPVLSPISDGGTNVGSTFTTNGSFSDPDAFDSWTATVDYGDGSGSQPLALNSDQTFNLSHVYGTPGNYLVSISVTDAAGATANGSFHVVVADVAPTINFTTSTSSSPEGSLVTFAASATSPVTDPVFTYTWSVTRNGVAYNLPASVDVHSPTFSFTPDVDGAYVVSLTVSDQYQASTTSSLNLTVTFAAQPLALSGNNIYLKADPDQSDLDIWIDSLTPGQGTATQKVPLINISGITINGGNGGDIVTLDESGGLISLAGGITINGGTGSNSVYIIGTTASDNIAIGSAQSTFNSTAVNYQNVNSVTYSDGGGNDSVSVTGSLPVTLNTSTGSDTISLAGTGPVTINTASTSGGTETVSIAAGASPAISLNAASGTIAIPASTGTGIRQVHFAGLNIGASGKVVLSSSAALGNYSKHANRSVAVIDAGGLNVASGGILDMGDNDMILHYASANETAARNLVSGLLASGFDGGGFDTTGINSSAASYDAYNGSGTRALGWMDNNDIGANTFDGVNTSDLNEVMVKFTYYGDSDLNGVVDATDFGLYAAGKSNAGTGWAFGNYDYNATTTDATDFGLFAAGLQGYRQFGAL